MIILDTDHLTILRYSENPQCIRLKERLETAASTDQMVATIVSADEQLTGWLARIHHERDVQRQVEHYSHFGASLRFYGNWRVEPFDGSACDEFLNLKSQRLRLGTQDLKIAAIALSRGALLLSANLRDFRRVPALRVENWLT